MRQEHESADRFKGEVDLKIATDLSPFVSVEVKSKSTVFTSPRDFPFPTVICYATRKRRKDLPVLFISQATEAIVGLCDNGSERYEARARDGARGFGYQVYEAPKRLLLPLDDWCDAMRRGMQVVA